LNIWLEVLGEKHRDVVACYISLGIVCYSTGDYEKAISWHNKALNIGLEVLGEKHPDVANSYYGLGLVYKATGDYENAISWYKKALNIWLEVLGEKHPTIANSYNSLAIAYEEIDNYKAADSLWQIVIPQSTKRLKSTYLLFPNNRRVKYSNMLIPISRNFYGFASKYENKSTRELATNFLLNTKSLALDYGISTNQLIQEINDTTLSHQHVQLNRLNKQLADAEILTIEERKEKGWDLSKIQEKQEALAFQMLQHPQLKTKLNTETIEWQDIQNHLAPDEITIDFLNVYEKKDSLWAYYAIVIHKDLPSPQFVHITDEKTLAEPLKTDEEKRIAYLYNSKSRKALHKALWQPLEPYLEGIKTVHISPSGTLHRVPFESLENEEDGSLGF